MMLRLLLACCVVVVAACECGRAAEAPAAEAVPAAAAPQGARLEEGHARDAIAPTGPTAGASAPAEAAKAAAPQAKGRVGGNVVRAVEAAFDGDTLVVMRNGARRIACSKACALEDACGFRDDAACVQNSCDGDVRTVSRMDYCLALDDSVTCLDAARCSCNESCWKRGECARDHSGDAECERACVTLVQQDGMARYRENRCVLEHACSEITACGAL